MGSSLFGCSDFLDVIDVSYCIKLYLKLILKGSLLRYFLLFIFVKVIS